jgi:hypothetical protein
MIPAIMMKDNAAQLQVDLADIDEILSNPLAPVTVEHVDSCVARIKAAIATLGRGNISDTRVKNCDFTSILLRPTSNDKGHLLLALGSLAKLRELHRLPAHSKSRKDCLFKPRCVHLMPMTNSGGSVDTVMIRIRDRGSTMSGQFKGAGISLRPKAGKKRRRENGLRLEKTARLTRMLQLLNAKKRGSSRLL